MKPRLTMRFSREASGGRPAGARQSCFVSTESGCFGRVRKIGREPKHCCCDRSRSRATKGRCRGNCDPRSALRSCGSAKIAARPPSVCSHPCEIASLKGLPPRILSARHCSLKGCKGRHDFRALASQNVNLLRGRKISSQGTTRLAFSSEVDTSSREENASKQKI